MKISIIIPAFNEERLLAATLECVMAGRAVFASRGWESELIVCDNNSTDRTAEIARAAGATVVFEPINQIARARNTGAKAATGDWLLFIDADSRPSRELFADVGNEIRRGHCLAGGSTFALETNNLLARSVGGICSGLMRWRRLLAGSFIFCEASVFRMVGGFSDELFVGEELELSKRLHAFGKRDGRALVILHEHPLLTSARKLSLYSGWEHLRFLMRVALRPGNVIRNREACHSWYDGRR